VLVTVMSMDDPCRPLASVGYYVDLVSQQSHQKRPRAVEGVHFELWGDCHMSD
jgi:hypothetical protein